MKLLGLAVGAMIVALLVGAWSWFSGPKALAAADLRRALADYRVEKLPMALPTAWADELEAQLQFAPEISLGDPDAPRVVRDLLKRVSWIWPESVRVELRVPEGLRVRFEPRQPRFRLIKANRSVAIVSVDGAILPKGMLNEWVRAMPGVVVPENLPIPEAGRRIAHPLVQEALDAMPELRAAELATDLTLVRIAPQPGYTESTQVPPALVFYTAEGREIWWGHAERSRNPLGLSLAQRVKRLKALVEMYPNLEGASRVVVDRPRLQAYDAENRPLRVPLES